jgi:hypothetical protein
MRLFLDDRARPHHYLFAHRALPASAASLAPHARSLALEGHLNDGLVSLWHRVGGDVPPEDRLPPTGLRGALRDVGGTDVVLVTMPRAEHMTEAHFAAVVLSEPLRYVVLEHSWTTEDRPSTVLGEWEGAKHLNLGAGPEPTEEAFLAAVAQRLS